jgi:hypothetical protein
MPPPDAVGFDPGATPFPEGNSPAKRPWTDGQAERMNRTLEDATIDTYSSPRHAFIQLLSKSLGGIRKWHSDPPGFGSGFIVATIN